MIEYDLLDSWRFTVGKYTVFVERQSSGPKTVIYQMDGLSEKTVIVSILLYPPMTEDDIDKILVLL